MGSISPDTPAGRKALDAAERLAHDVAVRQSLPWDLLRLRDAALPGDPQFATDRAATARARRSAGSAAKPTDEQIRIALEQFTVEEWEGFIGGFSKRDLEPLRAYLTAHKEELEARLGLRKYNSVVITART